MTVTHVVWPYVLVVVLIVASHTGPTSTLITT